MEVAGVPLSFASGWFLNLSLVFEPAAGPIFESEGFRERGKGVGKALGRARLRFGFRVAGFRSGA